LHGITRDSVITLLRDRGIEVQERKVSLAEVREGIKSNEIVEVFACGTAAVITPVGTFKSGTNRHSIRHRCGPPQLDAKAGRLTK
jgi:branched-chain amino acid aminotransferase